MNLMRKLLKEVVETKLYNIVDDRKIAEDVVRIKEIC